MSFRLFPLHEKMGAADLVKTMQNVCAEYSPLARATVLINMSDQSGHIVSILFYPDGANILDAEVINGGSYVDAINALIVRIEKGKD